MSTAHFGCSLIVECPKCFEYVDLDHVDEGTLVGYVFRDLWNRFSGYAVSCPHCKHEFKLDGVSFK